MVFTVFTGSVELAFRRHCDFEGLVEQSMVFTVFSKAQSSWPFEVTAILKAESSKVWYLLCLARLSRAGFSKSLQCRAGEGCRAKYGIYCV